MTAYLPGWTLQSRASSRCESPGLATTSGHLHEPRVRISISHRHGRSVRTRKCTSCHGFTGHLDRYIDTRVASGQQIWFLPDEGSRLDAWHIARLGSPGRSRGTVHLPSQCGTCSCIDENMHLDSMI